MSRPQTSFGHCACGAVEVEAVGAPIAAAACYCEDCQEGSQRIEALPGAPPVLTPDGGTPYLLWRRDRLRVTRGAERLTEMRLRPGSRTRRVVASCCNSAMYVDVAPAHWITAYRDRWADAPPLEMRLQTRRAPGPVPGDLPHGRAALLRLVPRLLAAWGPMLLRRRPRRPDGMAG